MADSLILIILTAWNDKQIYINPYEIAAIEPGDAGPVGMALAPGVSVPGAAITLAAGRTILVKEDADAACARLEEVIERADPRPA